MLSEIKRTEVFSSIFFTEIPNYDGRSGQNLESRFTQRLREVDQENRVLRKQLRYSFIIMRHITYCNGIYKTNVSLMCQMVLVRVFIFLEDDLSLIINTIPIVL